MDMQQVYEAVRSYAVSMKEFGWNEADGGTCAYKNENGSCCAFGCLIPPALYDSAMEGKSATDLLTCYPELASLFTSSVSAGNGDSLLNRIQNCHDTLAGQFARAFEKINAYDLFDVYRDAYIKRLDDIAANFGLKIVK